MWALYRVPPCYYIVVGKVYPMIWDSDIDYDPRRKDSTYLLDHIKVVSIGGQDPEGCGLESTMTGRKVDASGGHAMDERRIYMNFICRCEECSYYEGNE